MVPRALRTRPGRGPAPGRTLPARPDIGSTSWVASCGTSCSIESQPRHRPHHRRPARPRSSSCSQGWADHRWTQGERFGTIGAKRGDTAYEITTHRAEAYTSDSRKPHVVFADDVDADLSRRDFTVNAMALALPDLQLDRPVRRRRRPRGQAPAHAADARRRASATTRCGCCGPPGSSPATTSCPTPSWWRRSWRLRHRLEIVSAERIRDELDKLIQLERPGAGLWFVVDTGLAEEFLPELPAMRLEQDPIHRHKDVLAHTIAVVENVQRGARAGLRLPPHPAGGAVPRRRQAQDPLATARARASPSTTTRWSARG